MKEMDTLSVEDKTINFESLWRSLTVDPRFRLAEDLLGGKTRSEESIVKLLRNHKEEWVVDPAELEGRVAVDHWLDGISKLELAYLCGYIPDLRDLPELNRLKHFINLPPLKTYFAETYPLALPCILRLHLQGTVFESQTGVAGCGAFQAFGVLASRFRDDLDLQQFLEFLDDFHVGDFGLRELIACFEKSALVVSAMLKPLDQLRPPDRGIRGFFRFVSLSIDLDNLLQACESLPLVQSAIWFYYAYWFREFSQDVTASGVNVMKNIMGWLTSSDAAAEIKSAFPTVQEFSKNWQAALTRLVEGHYATPLLHRARLLCADSHDSEAEELQSFLARFENYERPRKKEQTPSKARRGNIRVYTTDVPGKMIPNLKSSGGQTLLQNLVDLTGVVTIEVKDSGKVEVISKDEPSAFAALQLIQNVTKPGKSRMEDIVKVIASLDSAASVELVPGEYGLSHFKDVSDLIKDLRDKLKQSDLKVQGKKIRMPRTTHE